MSAFRFPVEAGHVLTFARAIGDDNPVYTDPETAARSEVGGLIAPPTFTQAAGQFDPEISLSTVNADGVEVLSGSAAARLDP